MNVSDQSHMLTPGTTHPLPTLDSLGPTHTDPLSWPRTHASRPLLSPLPLTRPLSATLRLMWPIAPWRGLRRRPSREHPVSRFTHCPITVPHFLSSTFFVA